MVLKSGKKCLSKSKMMVKKKLKKIEKEVDKIEPQDYFFESKIK